MDVGSIHGLFVGPATQDYLYLCWVPFAAVNFVLAILGLKFNRTFPVLLSAVGLFAVCCQLSIAAASITEGGAIVVAGLCTFGGLGIGIIFAARYFLQGRTDPTTRDNLFSA